MVPSLGAPARDSGSRGSPAAPVLAEGLHVDGFGMVRIIQLDEFAVAPAKTIGLAYPQCRSDRYQQKPVQLLTLPLAARVLIGFVDAGLAQLAHLDPLLVV